MERPAVTGLKGVKLPVQDLATSTQWWDEVFAARPYIEFPDENGVVQGVGLSVPGIAEAIGLLHAPQHLDGFRGFNPLVFRVATKSAVNEWIAHLDRLGVDHSPLIQASLGHMVVFNDPDGIEIHVYSDEEHGEDIGYGRRIRPPNDQAEEPS